MRNTPAPPLAGTRSESALIGKRYAIPEWRGCATAANPKSDGSPDPMSVHRTPWSSLRYTVVLQVQQVGVAASCAILCTHCPNRGCRSGRNTADTPSFDGSQLAPPSTVRNTPAADTATVTTSGSRGR